MDWLRIVTLKGADIVLLPSNWWGQNHQVELWRARARQDGVWILAANRWGVEKNLFPPPDSYYMSDGPSAVISPAGLALQSYEAEDNGNSSDKIIYQTITVDRARIGGPNQTFSVANRRPSAYPALANSYYVPPANVQAPASFLPQVPRHQTADLPTFKGCGCQFPNGYHDGRGHERRSRRTDCSAGLGTDRSAD